MSTQSLNQPMTQAPPDAGQDVLAIVCVIDASLSLATEWTRVLTGYIFPILKRLYETYSGYQFQLALVTYGAADMRPSPLLSKRYFYPGWPNPIVKDLYDDPKKLGIGSVTGVRGLSALEGIITAIEFFDSLYDSLVIAGKDNGALVSHIIHVAASPDSTQRPAWDDLRHLGTISWNTVPLELQKRNINLSLIALQQITQFQDVQAASASGSQCSTWFPVHAPHIIMLSGFPPRHINRAARNTASRAQIPPHAPPHHPPAHHPPVQHHSTHHPPAQHPSAQHPAAHHPATHHPATHHPATHHPAVQHPPAQHPPAQHPPVQHPPVQHPPAHHPPVQHPPIQHPPTQHPAARHPPTRHPPAHHPPAHHPRTHHPPAHHAPGGIDAVGHWQPSVQFRTPSAQPTPSQTLQTFVPYTAPLNSRPNIHIPDLTKLITRGSQDPVCSGGYGNIYRCIYRGPEGDVEVAVKAIQPQLISVEAFRRELGIWKRLQHPNILKFMGITFGFGPDVALVSPWMINGTLTSFLEQNNTTLMLLDRLFLLHDVADGLDYLHTFTLIEDGHTDFNPVIHGDLTGANVLIGNDRKAYLADFGLSGTLNKSVGMTYLAKMSCRPGALRWAAPELISGEEPASASTQSDIYSFGSIMLQVLTGNVPWSHAKNDYEICREVVEGRIHPRPYDNRVADQHWNFMTSCWFMTPIHRPSAEEALQFVGHELEGFEAHRGRVNDAMYY